MNDLLTMCPVFAIPCIREKCASYEVHTKQRFKNIKTNSFLTIDQLNFYASLTESEKEQTIQRLVTIIRECRQLGKIIEIENFTDNLIPSVS